MTVIDQIAGSFVEEASERLAELEAALLELERDPSNMELVAQGTESKDGRDIYVHFIRRTV